MASLSTNYNTLQPFNLRAFIGVQNFDSITYNHYIWYTSKLQGIHKDDQLRGGRKDLNAIFKRKWSESKPNLLNFHKLSVDCPSINGVVKFPTLKLLNGVINHTIKKYLTRLEEVDYPSTKERRKPTTAFNGTPSPGRSPDHF